MANLANAVKLGKDCTLTVDGTDVKGITSVSITCEADMIDVTTRDDYGYAKELPGKKKVSVEIEAKRIIPASDAADTQAGLFAAWKNQTPAGVTIVSDGGLLVINGTFVVNSIEESQSFDDAVTLSISLSNYGALSSGSGT